MKNIQYSDEIVFLGVIIGLFCFAGFLFVKQLYETMQCSPYVVPEPFDTKPLQNTDIAQTPPKYHIELPSLVIFTPAPATSPPVGKGQAACTVVTGNNEINVQNPCTDVQANLTDTKRLNQYLVLLNQYHEELQPILSSCQNIPIRAKVENNVAGDYQYHVSIAGAPLDHTVTFSVPTGPVGPQGMPGEKGVAGDKGDTGEQGAAGEAGIVSQLRF